MRPGAPLAFPRDFGSHPQQAIEWWYITAALDVPGSAEPYGGQITFFRSRTGLAADSPSRFAARQLLFAHAAITDPLARRLRHDQRIARAGFGIAEASTADTQVRLRDWSLARLPDASAPAGHRYRAVVEANAAAGFGYELDFVATQPVLRQGDGGYSRKGPQPDQASLYLSEPQLAVRGSLRIEGRTLTVTGRAWLDHEWSDALLAPDAVGWDWIGMNLDDGGALTAFRLRRADGSALWAGGSFRSARGELRNFGADEVGFEPGRRWRSAATQAVYPVEWRVDTPAGRFEVKARLDAQELDGSGSTGSVYWEGLSDLLDARGARVGRGYLEMTGYANRLRF
ncbi:MAG TPA: carotenoid 1,2-hydratase [Methylibium sp.]|nr:carotenoid 1,2-hydratase [Methylibium sp.]HEU4460269.1 carotenoid 1,2-hydratase [Methylibium sp.]